MRPDVGRRDTARRRRMRETANSAAFHAALLSGPLSSLNEAERERSTPDIALAGGSGLHSAVAFRRCGHTRHRVETSKVEIAKAGAGSLPAIAASPGPAASFPG